MQKGNKIHLSPFFFLALINKRLLSGYFYIIPAILLVFVLLYFPLFHGIRLSFFNYKVTELEPGARFVGFENYFDLPYDPTFLIALRNTLLFVAGGPTLSILGGILLGILLTQEFKLSKALRAIVLIPWILPDMVVGLQWAWMLQSQYGIVNEILLNFGLMKERFGWLASMETAAPMLLLIFVWKFFPIVALMVYSSIISIPTEIFEASVVDGASPLKKFLYITLPMIRPSLIVVFLLLSVWFANNFTIVFVTTGGGPANSSELLTTYLYKLAFAFFRLSYAATVSTINFLILLAFSLLYVYTFRNVLRGPK
ncbi:MAG: sugar ABC transporter permease [Nitrososphaerales archaeon]